MKIKALITVCLFFVSLHKVSSQDYFSNYFPTRAYKLSSEDYSHIKFQFKELSIPYTKERSKKNKYIEKEIASIPDYITRLDSNRLLIKEGKLYDLVNTIFTQIVSVNHALLGDQTYSLYIFRSSIPNASNLGGGVILVNLGLLSNLESEGELAYILSHELGHDINRDVLKGICQDANYLSNKEVQKTIKSTKKQRYGSKNALKELYTNYREVITEYGRETELIADSLGLFLYINTQYPIQESVNALKLLDSIDLLVYNQPIDYQKQFNFTSFPFKDSWLETDNSVLWSNAKREEIPDELKTHPDCKIRIKEIEKHISQVKNRVTKTITSNFKEIQWRSKIEIVEYLINTEQFGLALFHALQYSKISQKNEYLKYAILHCFTEIKNALRQHNFTSVVDSPDKDYTNSYNQLLTILNNMSASDYKEICNTYYNENIENKSPVYSLFLSFLNENEAVTQEKIDTFSKANKGKDGAEYYIAILKSKIPVKKK